MGLEDLRQRIKAKQGQHEQLKESYAHLYHQEGERNAELTTLRGDTSKQLASNNEFEG